MLDQGLGVLDKGLELQCMFNKILEVLNQGFELHSTLVQRLGVLHKGLELQCIFDKVLKALNKWLKLLCMLDN